MRYDRVLSGNRSAGQAGFSLIEVVLTLVILGLLMGLVTSNLRGAGLRNAIKAERGQLALLIEDLRTISLYANRDLSLSAYLSATTRGGDVDDFYSRLSDVSQESYLRRVALRDRIVLNQDLNIRPPGACTQASGLYRLSNGQSYTFSIERMTCNVRIG